LHTHFRPIPGTFDDYIGLPKDNGYQSLHTCVYPVRDISHKPIELQVRTELMHKEAEYGTAAHWRYKKESDSEDPDRHRAQWMEGLARRYENLDSPEDFIRHLHRQVFMDRLVVFGKGGRITRLSDKATVRDYLITSNQDFTPDLLVKVNGRAVSLDHCLRDGDSIELLSGGSGSLHPGASEESESRRPNPGGGRWLVQEWRTGPGGLDRSPAAVP
jgi:GTP pyrophosphokinase